MLFLVVFVFALVGAYFTNTWTGELAISCIIFVSIFGLTCIICLLLNLQQTLDKIFKLLSELKSENDRLGK